MIERYHWPRTFIVVGAPQVLLALFFHLTVPSPKTAKPTSSVFVDVMTLARKQPLRALWAGMFVSTIAAAMNKFLPSFCAPMKPPRVLRVWKNLPAIFWSDSVSGGCLGW